MYIYKKNTKKWCQKGVVPIEGDVEGVALALDLAEPLARLLLSLELSDTTVYEP